jgi:hypothetical protein
MYENEPTEYGFKMTFGGFIDADEMDEWAEEVDGALESSPEEWHCFVDMTDLEAMSEDGQELMNEIKSQCHDCGLDRVATLVESPTVRMQFEQMSDGTGGDNDVYLDVQSEDDPEETAVAWVRDGVEP